MPDDKPRNGPPKREEIEAQLDLICASAVFRKKDQPLLLLRYLIDLSLNPRPGAPTEDLFSGDSISFHLFKPENRQETRPVLGADERIAPEDKTNIVRQNAKKLRTRLDQYYHGIGQQDTLVIEIPLGQYRPAFYFRSVADVPLGAPDTKRLLRFRLLLDHAAQTPWTHRYEQALDPS
jgi:hypothetical protein